MQEVMPILQTTQSCRRCGGRDLNPIGGGKLRCRACGAILLEREYVEEPWFFTKLALRAVGLLLLVMLVDAVIAFFVQSAHIVGVYSTVVVFTGVFLLVLGGIQGGVHVHGGVFTMQSEWQARFGKPESSAPALMAFGGLALIGIGAVLHYVVGI